MPSTKTRPHPTLTVETIQRWRLIDDAPQLCELALQRRTLREQRTLLLARERERLRLLEHEHTEKQGRLAAMGMDVSTYPAFDPATATDPVLLECRAQILEVHDQLIQVEDAFQVEAEPVIAEYAALQKATMVQLMDRALEALDVLEEIGEAGERLCMQSWGVVGSYLSNIGLFQRMQRRDRAILEQERNRLAHEAEVFYA